MEQPTASIPDATANGKPLDHAQLVFSVNAIHLMRQGKPLRPEDRSRAYFGPFLPLIEDMAKTLAEAMAGQESDTAVAELMEVYWDLVRGDPQYRALV